jgi:hypothetical protein
VGAAVGVVAASVAVVLPGRHQGFGVTFGAWGSTGTACARCVCRGGAAALVGGSLAAATRGGAFSTFGTGVGGGGGRSSSCSLLRAARFPLPAIQDGRRMESTGQEEEGKFSLKQNHVNAPAIKKCMDDLTLST